MFDFAEAASEKLNGMVMDGPCVGRESVRLNPFGAVHVVDSSLLCCWNFEPKCWYCLLALPCSQLNRLSINCP